MSITCPQSQGAQGTQGLHGVPQSYIAGSIPMLFGCGMFS